LKKCLEDKKKIITEFFELFYEDTDRKLIVDEDLGGKKKKFRSSTITPL